MMAAGQQELQQQISGFQKQKVRLSFLKLCV
jgi:hypothetical protein